MLDQWLETAGCLRGAARRKARAGTGERRGASDGTGAGAVTAPHAVGPDPPPAYVETGSRGEERADGMVVEPRRELQLGEPDRAIPVYLLIAIS